MIADAIDLSGLRRVLVTKLRHHGDVLLASPVFQALKNHGPHLEIDALTYHDTTPMLTLHPAITNVFSVGREWKKQPLTSQLRNEWRLLRDLRARNYDLIVHLTEHPRGAWLKRLAGIHFGIAQELGARVRPGWKQFTHLYNSKSGNRRHTVELNLDALRRIGLEPNSAESRLVLIPGDAAEQSIDAKLRHERLIPKSFIHIHPTSRWFFKTWPVENFAKLLVRLVDQGHKIVLTSAPDVKEMKMIESILENAPTSVVNFSGQLSLKELAALSARARLFVGVDSAPMHIAAAMQTPVVALFGPSGEVEWTPWMVPHRLVLSTHPCRPCGRDGCAGSKVSQCLTTLGVERVESAIHDLLSVT
jgi:heptosyltransferase III